MSKKPIEKNKPKPLRTRGSIFGVLHGCSLSQALRIFVCVFLFSVSAHAQSVEADFVKKAESYFNALGTLKADFSQMNNDGSVDTGIFYLKRPGRLRFQYETNKDYIVADGLLMHYWDDAIKNYSNAPIGSTLADFFLAKKIKLSGDLKVTRVKFPRNGVAVITLVQSKNPDAGDLRLLFNTNPIQLTKWRISDAAGGITEITLTHVEKNVKLDPRLFVFKPPAGYDKGW